MSTFNMLEANSSGSSLAESKHYNMKQFIAAAREFSQTRADDTASIMNRHLQLLSVTIDLSTFDPHTSVVSEFFVSLHELLSSLEPRTALAWCCVNVLSVACRNPAARIALIHTYQFLPPLSRLLGDQLTADKKIRLLTVMQELTCGIKISWQIPHLPHLMSTLTRWVQNSEEEIVTLALGVLVNLCYKNLSAIYTLSRCVDVKQFVRFCISLKGVKTEVHVCKLLIILDYMNGKVPEDAFLKLVGVTFKSLGEAFKAKDSIQLRHVVEFFLDVKRQNDRADCISAYEYYDVEVSKLLNLVENNTSISGGDTAATVQEPECMALLFEFIHSLIEIRLSRLEPLYPRLITVALKWIQTDLVCSQALAILRTIAIHTDSRHTQILQPLLSGLPIFLIALEHREEEIPTNIEYNKRLGALMQLLKALVHAESIRSEVLSSLKEEHIKNVFVPLVGDKSPRTRANEPDTYSLEAVTLYVHALSLVDELAKADVNWVDFYTFLLQQKQIHMILAMALYNGSKDVKSLILSMASCHIFPNELVANAMGELQQTIHTEAPNSSNPQVADIMFPTLSVAQMERLDGLIEKLKEAISQNTVANIATSDVMELYEYKLASMGHAERAATASMEAASQRCTHLQHRTAQLTAELSRLHQLLFHTQQCHEDAVKNRNLLEENNKMLTNRLEAEKGRCKAVTSQLSISEKNLVDRDRELEDLYKKSKNFEQTIQNVEEQNADLKKVVAKLEDNLIKKEKLIEKKEELLSRANKQIEHFKMQVTHLDKQFKSTEMELRQRTEELTEVQKELANRKQIMDSITRLATSQVMKQKK